ncbi:MAG: DNA polymerase III subunit alpha [Legionellales bacterium]|nr:DNA polymerase III subunit alpha [Legionellales bacterium]OUX67703.1 MAG: DNA polymerase III subunit alpha [bacterium TMED178]
MNNFCHLRVHSEYSIKDGIIPIKALCHQVRDDPGMSAVALTDFGNFYGALKFYRYALSVGVRPIIGLDVLVQHADGHQGMMTFLCKNWSGYLCLSQWLTQAYLESSTPVFLAQWFNEQNTKDLIVLSGGWQSDWITAIQDDQVDQAQQYLTFWKKYFPNAYFLEIHQIGVKEEVTLIEKTIEIAKQFDLPVVATNPACFLNKEDYEAQQTRICIFEGELLSNSENIYTQEQSFKTADEMQHLFENFPGAIENALTISQRCVLEMPLGETHLPNYSSDLTASMDEILAQASFEGLEKRVGQLETNYQDRLNFELKIINQMGFASYFLIVADFIQWAKNHQVPVGPGRGSGAGSMVAYALGITDLDPIVHGLLFERFLNPMRVSMPDFDIDFCMDKRDLVIDYVFKHYGADKVSQIITFGTMAAKAVVRDVGRVLGMPYTVVDGLAKLIPFELGITLSDAIKQEPRLEKQIQSDQDVARLFDLALKLEGKVRNVGKHAGGVVIAPRPIYTFMPLYQDAHAQQPVTQFDKDDVESMGLVKFDFLGLRTLTIIDWAVKYIHACFGQTVNINDISLSDKATFQYLQNKASIAIFQLESQGMQELVLRLKPDRFEDLVALVALYRPGPLQSGMVDEYVDRKHKRKAITYLHPLLSETLDDTYGVILYQEQVMKIAQDLSGYTLGSADLLRRAMGKKKPEEMAKQRQVFIDGALENNIDKKTSTDIFDLIEKFAGYGFNKSHSAAYALLTYQTAWLKVHHTASFMAAVLSSELDNTDKILRLIEDCEENNVKIHPPDINHSLTKFAPMDLENISYGLAAIKGLGIALSDAIVDERQNGAFLDLKDLCCRLHKKINRRALEALVGSGALDAFKVDRGMMIASIDKALMQADTDMNAKEQGQQDLWSMMDENTQDFEYVQTKPISPGRKLAFEKDALGYYLSGHPLDAYQEEFEYLEIKQIASLHIGSGYVYVAGLQGPIRVINGRRGRFAFMRLEDASGQLETAFFNDTYDQFADCLSDKVPLICQGSIKHDEFNNGIRLEIVHVFTLEQFRLMKKAVLEIQLVDDLDEKELKVMSGLFKSNEGGSDVRLLSRFDAIDGRLKVMQKVRLNETLLESLLELDCVSHFRVCYD